MFNLLVDGNKRWVNNADVLILVIAKRSEFVPMYNATLPMPHTSKFDAGMATANMALQASLSGLVFHLMAGFDYDAAKQTYIADAGLDVDNFDVVAMAAVGKAAKDVHSEYPRTQRKSISEIFFKDAMPKE